MTILSRARADFRNVKGEVIFRIGRDDILKVITGVPEAIQEDPMFKWMIQDGTLDVVDNVTQRKKLELDPTAGTTADGKKIVPEAVETKPQKQARQRKPKKEVETAEPETAEAVTETAQAE